MRAERSSRAEWRLFEPPDGGNPTYVLYWHLVEGRIYDYGERFNAVPDPMRWWKDAVQQVFLGSREQMFIRLTSNGPSERLTNDPGVVDVLRSLERLGLSEKSPLTNQIMNPTTVKAPVKPGYFFRRRISAPTNAAMSRPHLKPTGLRPSVRTSRHSRRRCALQAA